MRERIFAGGDWRYLTALPRKGIVGAQCSGILGVGTAPKILADDALPPAAAITDDVCRVGNQGQHNLCWSWGWTYAHECALRLAGHVNVKLSPGHLCGLTNGGVDEGAGVDEPVPVLLAKGQAPESVIPELHIHPRDWPSNAAAEALRYRLEKVWDLGHSNVLQGLKTAIANQWPVVLGTNAWGGGHCVYATAYMLDDKGVAKIGGVNSWGLTDDWQYAWPNKPGYWLMPAARLLNGLNMFGAFAVQAVRPDPNEK